MRSSAFILAFSAIILWGSLATLGTHVTHVPPFLSVGTALCVSGIMSIFLIRQWRVPLKTFAVGIGGIFGYHFLYFTAFRYAPPVEASLMNYLWPLLIVLLSPIFLRGYQLRYNHIIGALMGLTGAGLIVTGGSLSLDVANIRGYLFAGSAAFVWASYSLLTKRLPPFPTAAVGGFCLISGLLSIGLYFAEARSFDFINSLKFIDWLILILLGIGPMGLAFFAWDASLKRGDPRIIGSLSYLTPLLSTSLLIFLGGRSLTWVSGLAMTLIVLGAIIGSLDMLSWKKQPISLSVETHDAW